MKGANTIPKTEQLIIIYTEVNIYLNLKSWAKFPLKNRQQSKAPFLTVNRQNCRASL